MNIYFINIITNLDLKHVTVSNTSDVDKITKQFDDHISVCKMINIKIIILVLK